MNRKLLGILAALAASGCSPISVEVDFVPSVNYKTLKTWAFCPEPKEEAGTAKVPPGARTAIRASIQEVLQARGFPEVELDRSDFQVAWHAGIGTGIQVSAATVAYGYDSDVYFVEQGATTREYTEGSLMIDFVRTKPPGKMVWRAVAQATLKPGQTREERDQIIHRAVEKMMAKFPPE